MSQERADVSCSPDVAGSATSAVFPVYEKELFIFDMGNVVIKNIHVLLPVAAEWNIPVEDFLADYRQYDFPLMDGSISTQAYWRHIECKFGIKVQGEPFAKHFSPVLNPPMVTLLKKLRSMGKRVVCGSNTFAAHWDILKGMGFIELFDAVYPSHELGMSKPARQYFHYILDHEGKTVTQAFFVDDYLENIEAAQKLGIDTLHYIDDLPEVSNGLTADEKLFQTFGAFC